MSACLIPHVRRLLFFFSTAPPTPEIYTLSLHDALPIGRNVSLAFARSHWPSPFWPGPSAGFEPCQSRADTSLTTTYPRSEEHTSELQSLRHLVCRLLLEKKKDNRILPHRKNRSNKVRAR